MDSKDNWTIAQTTNLIENFKRFPNLWDCNYENYRNPAVRKNSLRYLAKILCESKPGTTVKDVRAKLKTLRAQYGKEKRQGKLHLLQTGVDDYTPKLWCFDKIKFFDEEWRMEHKEYLKQETMEDVIPMNYDIVAELLEDDPDSNSDKNEQKIEKRVKRNRCLGWTKEQTFSLLLFVKQSPLLYDTTHPLYAKAIHRTKAYRNILENLKPYKRITILDLKAKLKTLRSQYLKEKRIIKSSWERRRVKYIPRLWCYEHLKFLDDRGKFLEEEEDLIIPPQGKEFEVGEQPDDCYVVENENEIYVKSFDDCEMDDVQPTSPVNEQPTRSLLHQKCLSLVESLTQQMQHEQENFYLRNENTPQALLGRMVESELLKVPDDVFEDVKWKIMKLLQDASKKKRK